MFDHDDKKNDSPLDPLGLLRERDSAVSLVLDIAGNGSGRPRPQNQIEPPLEIGSAEFDNGAMLDVILDRDFVQNRTIYFSYAEPFNGGGRTALARARLDDNEMPQLSDVKVIYRQHGPASSGNHFGSRIVQGSDVNLFVTNGEHHRS